MSIEHALPAALQRLRRQLQARRYAAVFGSSVRGGEDPDIRYWERIGEILAETGWGLLSGGYGGTMSYLADSHVKAGGYAAGIVCSSIPDRPATKCYSDILSVKTPFERLEALLHFGRVYIVLPGGIGTLVELSCAVWLQDREFVSERPMLVLGKEWAAWLDWFETVPAKLKGRRPLREIVTHVPTYGQFEREWTSLMATCG